MVATYRIVNIVAKAALEKEIDLTSFLKSFPKEVRYGADYYGERFAHFKCKEMQGLVAVWRSGKMMGLGTKTPEQSIFELTNVANKLNCGFCVPPSVSNIVSVATVNCSIDLDRMMSLVPTEGIKAIYEPEQFSGMIVRMELTNIEKEVSLLLFASGKLILLGLRSLEKLIWYFNAVLKSLRDVLLSNDLQICLTFPLLILESVCRPGKGFVKWSYY